MKKYILIDSTGWHSPYLHHDVTITHQVAETLIQDEDWADAQWIQVVEIDLSDDSLSSGKRFYRIA